MEPTKRQFIKNCAVRDCGSSSGKNPGMVFVVVPIKNQNQRKKWLTKMNPRYRAKRLFCCELHFDLMEDCANYAEYCNQPQGFRRYFKLKKGVVPHKNLPTEELELVNYDKSVPSLPDVESIIADPLNSDGSETVIPQLQLPTSHASVDCQRETPNQASSSQSDIGTETMISKTPLSISYAFVDCQPGTSSQASSQKGTLKTEM
ncbi:uncharacterized protein LOC134209281 [Armigeres subalbatus]|uniref:uncharacterized protein LOC134209281 n=1 Tax=Armigeres subalbatus TaxID=124917 RepID=UPI002ED106F8